MPAPGYSGAFPRPPRALVAAARAGDARAVEQAITEDGARAVLGQTSDGETLLTIAVAHQQLACVRTLLAHGADPNTCLGLSSCAVLSSAAESGALEIVEALIAHGASIEHCDRDRLRALHHASRGGHCAVAKALLGAGATPDAADSQGRTPLHLAARYGATGVLPALLAATAHRAPRDHVCRTPLETALSFGQHAAADMLRAAARRESLAPPSRGLSEPASGGPGPAL